MRRIALGIVLVLAAVVLPATSAGSAAYGVGYAQDFPDPFVLPVGTGYFAYGTSGPLGKVQVLKSSGDVRTWTPAGDAMPTVPSWGDFQANKGGTEGIWAPAVLPPGPGRPRYTMFTAVKDKRDAAGRRCLSKATSDKPEGPFTDIGDSFLCDTLEGRRGVIDPSVFVAPDGAAYLLWKSEGIKDREPPTVWSWKIDDARSSITRADGTPIARADQPWEFPLVENPAMVSDGGRYYLFFSGQVWDTANYAIGWAECRSPTGPCAKPPNKRLIVTEGADHQGPGAPEVFRDGNGAPWIVYHAWDGAVGYPGGNRTLRIRPLEFRDGVPSPADAPPQPVAARIAGGDRFATAATFSGHTVPPFPPVVCIANGGGFADALAASPRCGVEGGPVLLVGRDGVPDSVRAELQRLAANGAIGHIVVAGGTSAVSDAVVEAVKGYANGSIHREAGTDRYDTAARLSHNVFATPGVPVAYVATGTSFADALAGGAAGAANRGPLLLVTRDGIPDPTGAELARLRPQRIVVLGGTAAVSTAVEAQLRQFSGTVTRVAGGDRYETAAMLATQEFAKPVGGVVVATGVNFPDAVAAGAAAYPVLLVPPTGDAPGPVRAAMAALSPQGVVVLGGPGAVSDATVRSLGV